MKVVFRILLIISSYAITWVILFMHLFFFVVLWHRSDGKNKVLFGLGGGHYASRHMDIVA